jgi:hypothetical protein
MDKFDDIIVNMFYDFTSYCKFELYSNQADRCDGLNYTICIKCNMCNQCEFMIEFKNWLYNKPTNSHEYTNYNKLESTYRETINKRLGKSI